MKISDLPAPVTASKADWLAGTHWLGFTPTGSDRSARAKCQSTIQRQLGSGYVVEYITEQFSAPNPGFESHPQYLADRSAHADNAGRLIAVHRLRNTARPLEEVLGAKQFKELQDMWAQDGRRFRWSVAFPIVESYEIVDRPKAKAVLGDEAFRRLYAHSSATLRPLTESERLQLSSLSISPVETKNARIGIEDEFEMAELSQIEKQFIRLMTQDISEEALEGETFEAKVKIRRRAAWIAQRFARLRMREKTLFCDECAFDPATKIDPSQISPRSLLDVHHKNPLAEGKRYTTEADLALLCPTCHRLEHARLKLKK